MRRLWPEGWTRQLRIVQPETVIGWHRRGWRLYWTWRSRSRLGRPRLSPEVRELIARMSRDNPLWGLSASAENSSSCDRDQQSIDSPLSMAGSQAGEKSGLANVSAESAQGHLGGRPIRWTDDRLPNFVCVLLRAPRAQGADSVQGHREPDGGLDLEAGDRSHRLGPSTATPDS